MSQFFKKTLISLVIGLGIAFVVMAIADIFNGEDVIKKLCDGFFTGAVVLLCTALLRLIAGTGEYDTWGYVARTINPFKKKYVKYDDYKSQKEQERKDNPPPSRMHTFLAGGILLVVAVIFLIIFYT